MLRNACKYLLLIVSVMLLLLATAFSTAEFETTSPPPPPPLPSAPSRGERFLFDVQTIPKMSETEMIELYHLRSFPHMLITSQAGTFSVQTSGLALRSATSVLVFVFEPMNYTACFLPIVGVNGTLAWDARSKVSYMIELDITYWQQSTFLARVNGVVYANYIQWVQRYVKEHPHFYPFSVCSGPDSLSCFTYSHTWDNFLADSMDAFSHLAVQMRAILPPRASDTQILSFVEPVKFTPILDSNASTSHWLENKFAPATPSDVVDESSDHMLAAQNQLGQAGLMLDSGSSGESGMRYSAFSGLRRLSKWLHGVVRGRSGLRGLSVVQEESSTAYNGTINHYGGDVMENNSTDAISTSLPPSTTPSPSLAPSSAPSPSSSVSSPRPPTSPPTPVFDVLTPVGTDKNFDQGLMPGGESGETDHNWYNGTNGTDDQMLVDGDNDNGGDDDDDEEYELKGLHNETLPADYPSMTPTLAPTNASNVNVTVWIGELPPPEPKLSSSVMHNVTTAEISRYFIDLLTCMQAYQLESFTSAVRSCMSENVAFLHVNDDQYFKIQPRHPFAFDREYFQTIPDPVFLNDEVTDPVDFLIGGLLVVIAVLGGILALWKLKVCEWCLHGCGAGGSAARRRRFSLSAPVEGGYSTQTSELPSYSKPWGEQWSLKTPPLDESEAGILRTNSSSAIANLGSNDTAESDGENKETSRLLGATDTTAVASVLGGGEGGVGGGRGNNREIELMAPRPQRPSRLRSVSSINRRRSSADGSPYVSVLNYSSPLGSFGADNGFGGGLVESYDSSSSSNGSFSESDQVAAAAGAAGASSSTFSGNRFFSHSPSNRAGNAPLQQLFRSIEEGSSSANRNNSNQSMFFLHSPSPPGQKSADYHSDGEVMVDTSSSMVRGVVKRPPRLSGSSWNYDSSPLTQSSSSYAQSSPSTPGRSRGSKARGSSSRGTESKKKRGSPATYRPISAYDE